MDQLKPLKPCSDVEMNGGGECGECPAGIGSTIYFAPIDKINIPDNKPTVHADEIYKVDLKDNGGGLTRECEKGFSITGTAVIEGKISNALKKVLYSNTRLPRRKKKRCINRVLQNKRILVSVLSWSMIDRYTTFQEIVVAMFSDKPLIDENGKTTLFLSEAEWQAASTLLKRIYKHRRKLLIKLWQRDRELFHDMFAKPNVIIQKQNTSETKNN